MSIYRNTESLHKYLINWIKEKVLSSGMRGAVLGVSGGVDSSLLAGLLAEALGPQNIIGVIMPCHSLPIDEQYALLLAKQFKFRTYKVDLTSAYDLITSLLTNEIGPLNRISRSNIKPRLRMSILYSIAQQNNYMVCGATNKDELLYGYFTKHGDSGVDIFPLADLLKGEVTALASYIGVPDELVKRKPTAGLWEGQSDEEEIGLTYQQLDKYFYNGEISSEYKNKVEAAVKNTAHKRKFPDIAEIPEEIK